MNEQVKEAREYFKDHLSHIHIEQVTDEVIARLLGKDYIQRLNFKTRMYCLYDHFLSQGLCDVTE
jgi:cytosine/adenosine deaminase-related metal-dependent hydrolase